MRACPYEFSDKVGPLKGHDICTLSGRQCFIDDRLQRAKCSRLAQITEWLKKHEPTGDKKLAR